jgi:hypothetical protein
MIKTVKDLKESLKDLPDDELIEIYVGGDESYDIGFVEMITEEDFRMAVIFVGSLKEI